MRVFRVEDNLGIAAGRNRQLAEARGEFVAIIEDDDWWAADKLEKQTWVMRENPEVGAFFSSFHIVNNDGEKTGTRILDGKTHSPINVSHGKDINISSCSGQLFRRSALNAIGGWRPWFSWAEDTDLEYRMVEKFPFYCSSLPLYYWRSHEGNTSGVKSELMVLMVYYSFAALYSAYCRRTGKPDIVDESPSPDLLESFVERAVMAGFMPAKRIRRLAKTLIITKKYSMIRRVIAANKAAGGRGHARLLFKLLVWSLIHNRLGFWLCRK